MTAIGTSRAWPCWGSSSGYLADPARVTRDNNYYVSVRASAGPCKSRRPGFNITTKREGVELRGALAERSSGAAHGATREGSTASRSPRSPHAARRAGGARRAQSRNRTEAQGFTWGGRLHGRSRREDAGAGRLVGEACDGALTRCTRRRRAQKERRQGILLSQTTRPNQESHYEAAQEGTSNPSKSLEDDAPCCTHISGSKFG